MLLLPVPNKARYPTLNLKQSEVSWRSRLRLMYMLFSLSEENVFSLN